MIITFYIIKNEVFVNTNEINLKLNSTILEMDNCSPLFVINPQSDFTRNRIFTFEETIKCILGMRGNTLNKELYDFFKFSDKYATTSAFVQQREKILPETFEYLFHEFNNKCNDTKTYCGMKLYAIDGSDLNIPYNENSDTHFNNNDNKGFNQFHINAMYDLTNKTYKDCIIQPAPMMNEPKSACQMIRRSKLSSNSVILADRGYGALNLLETCNRANVKYLIRVKNDWISEVKEMPMCEFDKEISIELRTTQTNEDKIAYRNKKAKYIAGVSKFGKEKKGITWEYESPFIMKLRIVRFKISDDTYETIVTSLDRFRFPIPKIKEMYHLRWGIETSFRELKYILGLINLHSRKEDLIKQEIFAKLIMYNYSERIVSCVKIKPKQKNKYNYYINFTMAVQICLDYFKGRVTRSNLKELLLRYIRPERPNRQDLRKIRPKPINIYFTYRIA